MEEEVFSPNSVCGACRWASCGSWEAKARVRKCCSSADNSDELLALLSLVLQPPASASARAWTTLRSSSIESPAVFPLSIILLRSCGCCSFFSNWLNCFWPGGVVNLSRVERESHRKTICPRCTQGWWLSQRRRYQLHCCNHLLTYLTAVWWWLLTCFIEARADCTLLAALIACEGLQRCVRCSRCCNRFSYKAEVEWFYIVPNGAPASIFSQNRIFIGKWIRS